MNCSTPGFPVLHYLLEFSQTHIHYIYNFFLSVNKSEDKLAFSCGLVSQAITGAQDLILQLS